MPRQDADDNQRLILQSISGNKGRKLKRKVKMCYSTKKKVTNLTTLKLFAQYRAEKLQLKEWKTDLLQNMISKIVQIYKIYNNTIET